jgi:EAL domain-containing protein (putative c-di-GMP-specific phosphodiesterase class I)
MFDVGRCVLAEAFRSAGMWEETLPRPPTSASGSISPQRAHERASRRELAIAMRGTGLDPRRITLEITESTMSRDEQGAVRALRRLRELGVRVSIDDFGTGYSSLSRLAELPIDMLKIPKTFIDQLANDDDNAT